MRINPVMNHRVNASFGNNKEIGKQPGASETAMFEGQQLTNKKLEELERRYNLLESDTLSLDDGYVPVDDDDDIFITKSELLHGRIGM